MRNEHRPNPVVVATGIALIALVTAVGLASTFDTASRSGSTTRPESPTEPGTGLDDTHVSGNRFSAVPEGAIYAELGSLEPVVLSDATEVLTLVESPDPGLLEVGVRVSRGGAPVSVNPGEFTLVTDDGRVFTPSDYIEDGASVVFTINAQPDGNRYKLVWQRELVTKLVMFDTLDHSPVVT